MYHHMLSTCVKCGGHLFQLVEQEPSGSAHKLQFVQCSSCGVPVGAMEYYNSGAKLEKLERKIANLESQLGGIQDTTSRIQILLQRK